MPRESAGVRAAAAFAAGGGRHCGLECLPCSSCCAAHGTHYVTRATCCGRQIRRSSTASAEAGSDATTWHATQPRRAAAAARGPRGGHRSQSQVHVYDYICFHMPPAVETTAHCDMAGRPYGAPLAPWCVNQPGVGAYIQQTMPLGLILLAASSSSHAAACDAPLTRAGAQKGQAAPRHVQLLQLPTESVGSCNSCTRLLSSVSIRCGLHHYPDPPSPAAWRRASHRASWAKFPPERKGRSVDLL